MRFTCSEPAGAVPAAFILGAVAAMADYPLTEDKFRHIVRDVLQRRAARDVGAVAPAATGEAA